MNIDLVRISLASRGWDDKWFPVVRHVDTFEVPDGWTPDAGELLKMAKEAYPTIPRHEFALVGFPEMKELVS